MRKFLFVIFCSLFAFCDKGNNKQIKLESYAKYGDFFILADDRLIQHQMKETFLNVFSAEEENLLPPKPRKFLPRFLPLDQMGNFTRRYFNSIILLDNKSKDYFLSLFDRQTGQNLLQKINEKNAFGFVINNLWAKPQKTLIIYAENQNSLLEKIVKNQEKLIQYVEQAELSVGENKMFPLGKASNSSFIKMKKSRKFALPLHPYYRLALNKKEMLWYRRNSKKMDYAICIYEEPFASESQFELNYIKKMRNQKTKKFLKGQLDNTYVEIDPEIDCSFTKENFSGMPCYTLKGWWSMKNDFMAGPFVTRTIFDQKNKRVITIDGHLYGPEVANKINHLRELEVYIHTFEPSL